MTPCTVDDIRAYDPPKIYEFHDGWPPLKHAKGHVIAKLRAQNAALLAEIERLRERLTITDEVVEAAGCGFWECRRRRMWKDIGPWDEATPHERDFVLTPMRAALLAAGMEAPDEQT